jgi:dihydropteroate synthase
VVNVTPDSFSDGGEFVEPGAAIAHGLRLSADGADIVDVGGESTRPGAAAVAADEELRRVIPVVEALAGAGVLVSIDTRKAAVMRAAVAAGAGMINDISALRHDPESLAAAGGSGVPVVLMHSQGEPATMQVQPTYDMAPLDVFDHLAARVQAWTDAGYERSRLLIDPGIGFGKPARAVPEYGSADFARGVAQELHRAHRGRDAAHRAPAGLPCRGIVERGCRSRGVAGS